MNKFRFRLLFGFITLITIVLVGIGILLGAMFKGFYLNTYNERMEKETNLVGFYVSDQGLQHPELLENLKLMSESLDSRITILNKDGSLFLDSLNSGKEVEDMIHQYLSKTKNFKLTDDQYDVYYYGAPIIKNGGFDGYVILSTPVESLKEVYEHIWVILIASLGLALIVIVMLGVKITTQYTKPIESATAVAIELAKGNYKARTYEESIDETGMLSQSINILARNLQNVTRDHEMQQDRLRTLIENMGSGLLLIDGKGYINLANRAYKELFSVKSADYSNQLYHESIQYREIVALIEEIFMTEETVKKQLLLQFPIDRKHFEVYGAPIIGLNDEWKGIVLVFHDISELKKLEQMRKDFVANVSHELKTPITSIKGFSETLLDGALEDRETLESFLSIILKESERLQSLIEDLLELSKVEQQGFQLNLGQVNMNELIEDTLIMLKGKAEEKEIRLDLIYNDENIFISGDVYRLKQIFINLITNAITYTPPNGKIKVDIRKKKEVVEVFVIDTGTGIDEKELPRIFERFYRVDKARSRNSGGTGLGLAIVKHLVEAHHGEITVTSKPEEGTSFRLAFKRM
ncbi:two-component system histidine kinase PnpS [Litchfieldia salsa]|uniref:histidine kinase n=1 Tax=Litchfieldia salsa TaxID=930152 RepID=A0A1H0P1Q5_9BACI|nr:ATP-binding protein [Litchfieldia salsa]SDO98904.1 two-component system, OmpR family, phosphate regulon sensor histidine kinase PhoR [Litchfieldia salsa]